MTRTRIAALPTLLVGMVMLTACGPATGDVFSLEVGDCFDDPDASLEQVFEVPIVDCDEPHDNQVYAIFELGNGAFPGDTEVAQRAQAGCIDRFDDYVGVEYAASALFATWLYPTEVSWEEGDREVICVLFDQEGPLEGSLRGARQ